MSEPDGTNPIPRLSKALGWVFRDQRAVLLLFLLVIVGDAFFILLHITKDVAGWQNRLLELDTDRGYAEVFQYIKFIYIIVLLSLFSWARRTWQVALWIPVFIYLLLDDSLRIHETGGGILVRTLGLQNMFALRAQDYGELLVVAIAGALLAIPLVIGYYKGTQLTKSIYRLLLCLVILLAIVGVGIDMLHIAARRIYSGYDFIAIIEDGGEMIVVSLIVAFCLRLNISGGAPGVPRP